MYLNIHYDDLWSHYLLQLFSHPGLWGGEGGTFANILPAGGVCQFWVKIQLKSGKHPFCTIGHELQDVSFPS